MNPYKYTKKLEGFVRRTERQTARWEKSVISFPVVSANRFPDSPAACADFYFPVGLEKHPCVLLVHGWGDRSALPLMRMAKDLTESGIAAAVLYLPFHSRRAAKEIRKKGTRLSKTEWVTGYQMMITDIQHFLDWLETQPEIDISRVGIIGLSLGAFMGAIAMGIDSRLKAGVFMVSGGNAGKVAQFSRFGLFRKAYAVPLTQYDINQKAYHDFLVDIEKYGWETVSPARPEYFNDPLTFAGALKHKPILMVNAIWDEFIPREATLEFWQATGRQELIWIKSTHATIWVFYPRILRQVKHFLKRSLIDIMVE